MAEESSGYGQMFSALGQAGFGIGGKIYSKKEAAKARSWSERMYKRRYQHTVADMRAAGLNPILAASGGFNVGSGPTVSKADSTPGTTPGLTAAQMELMHANSAKAGAEARKAKADAKMKEQASELLEPMAEFLDRADFGRHSGKAGSDVSWFLDHLKSGESDVSGFIVDALKRAADSSAVNVKEVLSKIAENAKRATGPREKRSGKGDISPAQREALEINRQLRD